MNRNRIVIIFLIFQAIAIQSAFAQIKVDTVLRKADKLRAQVFAGWGMVFGSSAKEFFEEYRKSFAGTVYVFKDIPVGSLGVRVDLGKDLRISVSGSYLRTTLHDEYGEFQVQAPTGKGDRLYIQDFTIETFPVMATLEYMNLKLPYRTYFGFGAGLAPTRVYWQESIESNIYLDKRKGGINYDDHSIFPGIKFLTGTELYFDRDFEDYFLGSLSIELSYIYIFRSIDIFKQVKSQFWDIPPKWNLSEGLSQKYMLAPGYLTLNFYVSFNLPRDKEKK